MKRTWEFHLETGLCLFTAMALLCGPAFGRIPPPSNDFELTVEHALAGISWNRSGITNAPGKLIFAGEDEEPIEEDSPQNPCSAHLGFPALISMIDKVPTQDQIQKIVFATCEAMGTCPGATSFDSISEKTIGQLGVDAHFWGTVRHNLEGHDAWGNPTRAKVEIEGIEEHTTLQQFVKKISITTLNG